MEKIILACKMQCHSCKEWVDKGEIIYWLRGRLICVECKQKKDIKIRAGLLNKIFLPFQ